MIEYLAYATTTDSMPGTDAGITVFGADDNTVAVETCGAELDGDLSHADTHMLDEGAADDMLARMGFSRKSDSWVESGGQWAAVVIRTS